MSTPFVYPGLSNKNYYLKNGDIEFVHAISRLPFLNIFWFF